LQSREDCGLQLIRIIRNDFEVPFERVGRVDVDEVDAVLNVLSGARQIATVKSPNDGATAECVGEFSREGGSGK